LEGGSIKGSEMGLAAVGTEPDGGQAVIQASGTVLEGTLWKGYADKGCRITLDGRPVHGIPAGQDYLRGVRAAEDEDR
jgi:hypothetical protein